LDLDPAYVTDPAQLAALERAMGRLLPASRQA
jgi:hypothetical protein